MRWAAMVIGSTEAKSHLPGFSWRRLLNGEEALPSFCESKDALPVNERGWGLRKKKLYKPWYQLNCLDVVVVQSLTCVWLCNFMDCSTPAFLVLHYSPRVCSNLCPFSQWCYPTISSSVALFPFFLDGPSPKMKMRQDVFKKKKKKASTHKLGVSAAEWVRQEWVRQPWVLTIVHPPHQASQPPTPWWPPPRSQHLTDSLSVID